jgi:hypothetical protein
LFFAVAGQTFNVYEWPGLPPPLDMLHLCGRRPKQRVYTLKIKILQICIFSSFVKTIPLCTERRLINLLNELANHDLFVSLLLFFMARLLRSKRRCRSGDKAHLHLLLHYCPLYSNSTLIQQRYHPGCIESGMFIKHSEEAETRLELMTFCEWKIHFLKINHIFKLPAAQTGLLIRVLLPLGTVISGQKLLTFFNISNSLTFWLGICIVPRIRLS